ncbi:hypothetical protein D6C78_07772 [Aureobasidium pullulans]|uniref:Uncharacterized protein n=1 Tax=Aureobasidium pullulans TaxID=5580 RepID=A0A4T0BFY6_AURPU|nr:hypothetical protein D6C78_07772 [Aureobasidium pullulans]
MTTDIQIEGLALTLEADSPLSLIVRDQPVVAVFENSTTQEKDSLRQRTSKLFVVLTIWIRAKWSRNKNNRTGRLMLLVVPAETLTLKSACDDYNNFAKQLPSNVYNKPSDDKSGKCKLLRMLFKINSLRNYVIMPQYKRQANATNQQMALLRELKGLSDSNQFELFTNDDEAVSAAVHNLCNIQAGSAVTLSVVEQGWREQGLVKKCAVAACKDAELVYELHDALGPPQYAPQAPGFEKLLSSQHRDSALDQSGLIRTSDHSLRISSDLPSTAPPYSTHAELTSRLHDITSQHASVATPDSRGFSGPATITRLKHVPTSSYNYIATFLSGFSGYSRRVPGVSIGHDGPTGSTKYPVPGSNCGLARNMRASSCARVEVPVTDPGNSVQTFASTSWNLVSEILDSQTRKRRLSKSSNN